MSAKAIFRQLPIGWTSLCFLSFLKGFSFQAAALPLVTTTGNQLMSATGIEAGQTVLVVGAAGKVGRPAVFTAKSRAATVIAGVLKRQIDDAKTIDADQLLATDDDAAIASLVPIDAVADTVGGRTAEKLIGKVKPGGVYASVVATPQSAAYYPAVKVVQVFSKFDRKTLEFMAEAVRDGKLVIPIGQKLPLSEAAEAQAEAENGAAGKILLVAWKRHLGVTAIFRQQLSGWWTSFSIGIARTSWLGRFSGGKWP
jgi:NADPH:quinone reductase-like Zn-dependent oxidoreductase